MSQRVVEKFLKPKKYQTEQLRIGEESEVIDPRMKIDLLTRELILRYRLTNRITPVLSIPLTYNKSRGVFELIETPSLITSRLQAYYYPTLPSETTPGYVDLATDAQHRLYVVDDQVLTVLTQLSTPTYAQLINADETTAQSVTLDTREKMLLEVYARADAATTFHLDVSTDNSNWVTDYKTYSNVTSVSETLWNGFRYVRLRSDATGTAGSKVTLILSAK